VKINDLHKAATFLHPKYKHLIINSLTLEESEEIKSFIKDTLLIQFVGYMEGVKLFERYSEISITFLF